MIVNKKTYFRHQYPKSMKPIFPPIEYYQTLNIICTRKCCTWFHGISPPLIFNLQNNTLQVNCAVRKGFLLPCTTSYLWLVLATLCQIFSSFYKRGCAYVNKLTTSFFALITFNSTYFSNCLCTNRIIKIQLLNHLKKNYMIM